MKKKSLPLSVLTHQSLEFRPSCLPQQSRHRQPLYRLQLPLDIPQRGRLGVPLPKRIAQPGDLAPEVVLYAVVCYEVSERPWDLWGRVSEGGGKREGGDAPRNRSARV
jgi:hypothetical protein